MKSRSKGVCGSALVLVGSGLLIRFPPVAKMGAKVV